MPATRLSAFAPQLITQHSRAHERVLQVQLVETAHQGQISITYRTRQVIHRAPADG